MSRIKAISKAAVFFVFVALSLASSLVGQQTGKKLPDLKLASKLMGRDMSYRVVLPPDYNSSVDGPVGKDVPRLPVIYLLHGLTGNFANWTDKTKLTDYALNHRFIIVTPDGGDGWYTDSVSAPNDKYESYIVKELIPEIDKNYRTVATRDGRVIAGLSMGGYGSLKFGLKYPEMFTLIGSFSGALGATSWTEKTAGTIGKSMDAVFGTDMAAGSRTNNDIFKIARELTPDKVKSLPYVYQSCGTEDFLIQNNRDFLKLLNDAKVPHEYREHPGIHDWVFWDDQVREFLDLADRRIKK